MTPLILTALAVAFAFRCGMFNIGGQGQYIVGLVCSLWVGLHFAGMPKPLHIFLALLAATLGGAVWAAIAGALKASVGAHEVISTIMLNWIAIFGSQYLFELGGPLQGLAALGAGVEHDRELGAAARHLGHAAAAPRRHLHRARRRSSSTGSCSTARRSASR